MADLKTCSGFSVEHTTKRTKDTKDSENCSISISYFVLFGNFVVKCLFRF